MLISSHLCFMTELMYRFFRCYLVFSVPCHCDEKVLYVIQIILIIQGNVKKKCANWNFDRNSSEVSKLNGALVQGRRGEPSSADMSV